MPSPPSNLNVNSWVIYSGDRLFLFFKLNLIQCTYIFLRIQTIDVCMLDNSFFFFLTTDSSVLTCPLKASENDRPTEKRQLSYDSISLPIRFVVGLNNDKYRPSRHLLREVNACVVYEWHFGRACWTDRTRYGFAF